MVLFMSGAPLLLAERNWRRPQPVPIPSDSLRNARQRAVLLVFRATRTPRKKNPRPVLPGGGFRFRPLDRRLITVPRAVMMPVRRTAAVVRISTAIVVASRLRPSAVPVGYAASPAIRVEPAATTAGYLDDVRRLRRIHARNVWRGARRHRGDRQTESPHQGQSCDAHLLVPPVQRLAGRTMGSERQFRFRR